MAEHLSIFAKKTLVVITGASRGLGKSIALQFGAKFPADSFMVLMDILPLESVRSEVLSLAPDINVVVRHYDQGNVETKGYFKDIFDKLLMERNLSQNDFEQFIIVHNCGTCNDVSKRCLELSDSASVQKYFDINLTGMILLNTSFFKTFSDTAKSRVVINMTSLASATPLPNFHLYCAGKTARDMYMRVLALEEPSLRILCFAPGTVDTDMMREVESIATDKTIIENMKKLRADGTMTSPDIPISKLVQILEENTFENAVYVASDKVFFDTTHSE